MIGIIEVSRGGLQLILQIELERLDITIGQLEVTDRGIRCSECHLHHLALQSRNYIPHAQGFIAVGGVDNYQEESIIKSQYVK